MFDSNIVLQKTHPEFKTFDKAERGRYIKRIIYTAVAFIAYAILAYTNILPFYIAVTYLAIAMVLLWGLIFLVKELMWIMSCDLDEIPV